jgi:TPR repeat protein
MFSLAYELKRGNALRRDISEAALWWKRHREAGHAESMYELAVCMKSGEGIEENG